MQPLTPSREFSTSGSGPLAARGYSPMNGDMKETSTSLPADSLDMRTAKFRIGQVVKHRVYPFRGVIFDVDPVFANTEE